MGMQGEVNEYTLTKTDYLLFLKCSQFLWLQKHKPEMCPQRVLSEFQKMLIGEGYVVEGYAQKLFPHGQTIPLNPEAVALQKTKEAVDAEEHILFQATFKTGEGVLARTDILERNGDGSYNLYEVKSSTEVKEDAKHNHIKDASFQVCVLKEVGLTVHRVYIIHVDSEYVRENEVEAHRLLKKTDVTAKVLDVEDETKSEISQAVSFLKESSINENRCDCYEKTRSNHCDAFSYFNKVPEGYTVWELANIRKEKLGKLFERDVVLATDMPSDIKLSTRQLLQIESARSKEPVIKRDDVLKLLNKLIFPLYFLDYETASHAVPQVQGMKPWEHVPFQWSLHVLREDGSLEHEEHLDEKYGATKDFIKDLCEKVGTVGSTVSWHASFEKKINKDLIVHHPEFKECLEGINKRMIDLEDFFKELYVDARFHGSSSIKKVLPVFCPEDGLSYNDLDIQDGGQAMEKWFELTNPDTEEKERDHIRKNLLTYCKLDTYAMVRIYQKLQEVVDK